MIRRSEEEKFNLIKQFKESGLSMLQWCNNNHIASSSMHAWLKKYDDKYYKSNIGLKSKTTNNTNSEIKFVELDNTITDTKSIDTEKNIEDKIVLEYKDFKINITDSTNTKLLKKILKVVTTINV